MDNWVSQLGIAFAGAMAWFVRLEARLSGKLDIKEHREICEKQTLSLNLELREIKRMITSSDGDRMAMKLDIQEKLFGIKESLIRISKNNPRRNKKIPRKRV